MGVGVGRFGWPRKSPEPGIEPTSFPNFRNARKEAGTKTKQKGGNVVEWIGRASRGRTPKPGMEPASFPNFRKATTEEQGKREKNSAARHLPAEIDHFILMASEAQQLHEFTHAHAWSRRPSYASPTLQDLSGRVRPAHLGEHESHTDYAAERRLSCRRPLASAGQPWLGLLHTTV